MDQFRISHIGQNEKRMSFGKEKMSDRIYIQKDISKYVYYCSYPDMPSISMWIQSKKHD
jgi:hypothetical protein